MSGSKVVCKSLFIITSVVIVFLLTTGVTGFADLSGGWENDLYLSSGAEILENFSSELYLSYFSGGINYTSSSLFKKDSYYAQTFGVATSIGPVGIDSTLDFAPQEANLNYFLTEADLTFSGMNIGNTFLLERTDNAGYGAGYQLELSVRLPEGPGVYVKNLFGMEGNQAEDLGIVRGSGFTIKSGPSGPSSLQYVNTTIEISSQKLDCCSFTSTTRLSEEKGFEYSTIEFDLDSTNLPIELGGKLRFSPQTKSVELDPKLDLGWACFGLYTDLSTADDENLITNNSNAVSTIGGLEVEGFGITEVNLGHVTFSSLTALKGNLNRLTDQNNMDLRAYDYVLDPDPIYAALYTDTPYDEVISIEKSGEEYNLTFGADVYFDMGGSGFIFDTALFTGSGNYDLSDQFALGAGVAIKPDKLETVRLRFDYYF